MTRRCKPAGLFSLGSWTYSAVVLERVLARCLQLRVKDLDQVAEHQVWKDDAALQSVVRGALFTCAAEVTHLAMTHPKSKVNLLCEVLCTVCGGVWVTDLRRSRSQILLQRRLRHLLKFALAATTCSERAHRCMESRLAVRVSTDGRWFTDASDALLTSVKRYPIWGGCGVLLWVPVCMRGGSRRYPGTQNRMGVYFNRGYDLRFPPRQSTDRG